MSWSWVRVFRSITSRARRAASGSRVPAWSMRTQPKMAFSGVRSS